MYCLSCQQVKISKIYQTRRSYKTRAGRGVWFSFLSVPLHLTPVSNTLLDFNAFRSHGPLATPSNEHSISFVFSFQGNNEERANLLAKESNKISTMMHSLLTTRVPKLLTKGEISELCWMLVSIGKSKYNKLYYSVHRDLHTKSRTEIKEKKKSLSGVKSLILDYLSSKVTDGKSTAIIKALPLHWHLFSPGWVGQGSFPA